MVTKRSLKMQLKKAIGDKLLKESTHFFSDYYSSDTLFVAYNNNTKTFTSDYELNEILTNIKSQVNELNFHINNLKFKTNINIIAYSFTDKSLKITTSNIDTIYYSNYINTLKFQPTSIKEYGKIAIRIIYYDDLSVYSRMYNLGFIPTPFKFNIDFLDVEDSIILKLKDFQLTKDLKRESQLTYYHKSKDTNFTYNQVLKYKNRNDFLLTEWKTMNDLSLYLNINKFTHTELFMFRKIKPRFTETEFRRLINWYHNNKEWYRLNFMCTQEKLFEHYIKNKCSYSTCKKNKHDYIYLSNDILDMSKYLKTKIEFKATSYNGLKRYHDELVQKLRLRKAKTDKNPFKLKEKWNAVHKLLKKSKLKIKHLNSTYLLDKESADMQHCVQIYNKQVKSGKSYIFHIDYYKKPYTCELVFRKDKIVINQLYGKYNQQPEPKLRQKLEQLLEKINN